ncbi:MAG: hypothetical protein JWR75_720 [Devosia sp.]|nr:hypothetical protein [Devosia sp.]
MLPDAEIPLPGKPPRLLLLDVLRGVAIIGVMGFHLAWDLYYFGYHNIDVMTDVGWVVFSRVLSSTFLFLVGVNFVLAHRHGMRWPAFWRRFAIVGGAALLISAITFFAFPESFIFFGILHAIALFSLLAIPALRAPLWLVLAVALAVLVAGFTLRWPEFGEKALAWIGFYSVPPPSNDLVPVLPWFGITLLGVALARLLIGTPAWDRLARLRFDTLPGRVLQLAGRWSLLIYLIHQPIIFGGLYLVSQLAGQSGSLQDIGFIRSCEVSCLASPEYDQRFCTAYCGCALSVVEAADMWSAIDGGPVTQDEQTSLDNLSLLCTRQAEPIPAQSTIPQSTIQ